MKVFTFAISILGYMVHLRYACLFIFLAVCSVAFSQTVYRGKVVDKATLEPIIGAIITIETPHVQRISTNVDGTFHYKSSVKPQISISYLGYKTLTVRQILWLFISSSRQFVLWQRWL